MGTIDHVGYVVVDYPVYVTCTLVKGYIYNYY